VPSSSLVVSATTPVDGDSEVIARVMAAIGIRIAIAGRWRGAARVWPAIAGTWVLVMLPVSALASAEVGYFLGPRTCSWATRCSA